MSSLSDFFGGGGQEKGPSPLTVAKMEAEILSDMFTKMTNSCSNKCVVKYPASDGDLAVGEMACIDRCVGKYIEAQNTVGGVLQQFEQKAKELAQAQMNASQARSDLGQRKF